MSAISVSNSRKRPYSPDIRGNNIGPENNLPQKKKRRDAGSVFFSFLEIPEALKSKLQQLTDWFFELSHVHKFARMAFKCGGTVLAADHEICLEDDDDEDDIVIEEDDDDVDEIQEIKENVIQEKLPSLTNGSSILGSHCNSQRQNGARIRELSTRYHRKSNCSLVRKPVDNLKCKPLVSKPPMELEMFFKDEPEVVVLDDNDDDDGIEVCTEICSSNQKSSQKTFHSSVKSPKNASPTVEQAESAPAKISLSTSKFYTANEVIRIQEKAQYKLLLEKCIHGAQQRHTVAPESVKDIVEDSRMLSGKHFKKHVLEQPILSFMEKYYKPCQLLPPKPEKSSEKKTELPEVAIVDEDDDEVQIIEMKKSTYKSVFNSHLLSNSWLSELQKNVCKQTIETNKIVEDYERQLEKLKTERLLRKLKIDTPIEPAPEPEFPELTPEMEDIIDKVLNTGSATDIIHRTPSSELTRKDLDTLLGLHWLNDAVINSYIDLIIERNEKKGYPSIYSFNTYFYSALKNKGFNGVTRWTRKINIFKYDIILIPIHLAYHWCLGVIDNRGKKICYYDSMGTSEEDCLHLFHEYLCCEFKDKQKKPLDPSLYSLEVKEDIPQQMNGSDCGMFTLKYAEYISRNAEITFNQNHMQYFRRRAIYELVTRQLL